MMPSFVLRSPARILALLGLGLAMAACGSAKTGRLQDEATARDLYLEGLDYLTHGDYESAVRPFTEVAQFPRFMSYAALGKLRLADTLFAQDRQLEAMEVYEEFTALYPNDANVPYARFMASRAVYARMPADVSFFSPGERLDISRVLQARDRLADFLRSSPESPYAADAAILLGEVRGRLYRHHVFVSAFYRRREADRAESGRLMEAAFGYPEWGASKENLVRLVSLLERIEGAGGLERVKNTLAARFPPAAPAVRADQTPRGAQEPKMETQEP
jgi:outer membrane protein assembly factor BamD